MLYMAFCIALGIVLAPVILWTIVAICVGSWLLLTSMFK